MLSLLFNLSFVLVVPFWLLMIVAPRWAWSKRILASDWVALGPAIIYLILVIPILGDVLSAFAPPTIDSVMTILSTPEGTTLAYAHFIAFDFFVARWMALDALDHRISAIIMAPILLLTLMLGPVGYLVYLLTRLAHDVAYGNVSSPFENQSEVTA